MSDTPGIGVMLGMLGGNNETSAAIRASLGKPIASLTLDDDKLHFAFTDGTGLVLFDEGQSCCESRYMRTDDDLSRAVGATLVKLERRDAPSIEDEYGEHEVQFLDITTSAGVLQMASHNEHNGYYGGFWIVARLETPKQEGR